MDQGSGLLSQMGMDDRLKGEGAPRLGPRPFSISVVNSFGGNFVRRHLYPRTNFKLNRAAALAEWRRLLSV